MIQAVMSGIEVERPIRGDAEIIRVGDGNPRRRMANEHLSKFLTLVLRHKPQAASINLDEYGWADVNELISGLTAAGYNVGRAQLQEVVESSYGTHTHPRFRFSLDGTHIRANWGHSFPVIKPLD
jgi:putative RNA 2'-phosphotransferase